MRYGQKCSQEPMLTDDTWNLEVWGQLKDLILKCPKLQIPFFSVTSGLGMRKKGAKELTFIESASIIH